MVLSATTYYQSADLTFAGQTGGTVAAAAWTVDILDQTFPGGLRTGEPFWAEFEGALTLDVSVTDVYRVTLTTRHRWTVDGSPAEISTSRALSTRIARSGSAGVPLAGFDSVSTITLGAFQGVEIDDALLTLPTRITMTLTVERGLTGGGGDFIMQEASAFGGRVNFVQWGVPPLRDADIPATIARDSEIPTVPTSLPPTDGSVTAAKLAPDLVVPDSAIPPDVARQSDIPTIPPAPTELPPTDGSVTTAKLAPDLVVPDSAIPASIARDSEIPTVPTELPPTAGSVDMEALADMVAARLAPEPGEATRGRYVRQSPTGESYELVAAGPGGGDGPVPVSGLYCTVAEYRARNRSGPDAVRYSAGVADRDDDLISSVLLMASRFIDRRLGWCDGGLAPVGDATMPRTFWPALPSRVLRLRDSAGSMWPLREWTRIDIDYGGSGDPDYVIEPPAPWVVPLPDTPTRPAKGLRLHVSRRGALTSIWPSDPGVVVVTGLWGWAAVPDPIRELVAHTAREVLDSHAGGSAAILATLDNTTRLSGTMSRMWRLVEMEYSAGRMERLGVIASSAGSRRR